jgi:hypothetical protein
MLKQKPSIIHLHRDLNSLSTVVSSDGGNTSLRLKPVTRTKLNSLVLRWCPLLDRVLTYPLPLCWVTTWSWEYGLVCRRVCPCNPPTCDHLGKSGGPLTFFLCQKKAKLLLPWSYSETSREGDMSWCTYYRRNQESTRLRRWHGHRRHREKRTLLDSITLPNEHTFRGSENLVGLYHPTQWTHIQLRHHLWSDGIETVTEFLKRHHFLFLKQSHLPTVNWVQLITHLKGLATNTGPDVRVWCPFAVVSLY